MANGTAWCARVALRLLLCRLGHIQYVEGYRRRSLLVYDKGSWLCKDAVAVVAIAVATADSNNYPYYSRCKDKSTSSCNCRRICKRSNKVLSVLVPSCLARCQPNSNECRIHDPIPMPSTLHGRSAHILRAGYQVGVVNHEARIQ